MKYLIFTENKKPSSYTIKHVVEQHSFFNMDASIVDKRLRTPKGYARMDNSETRETVGTRDTRRRQTKQSKNNKSQRTITQ
jgi:hypothetical protein